MAYSKRPARAGAPLEKLVAFIEQELSGPDFSVTVNERRRTEGNKQAGEFDIVVRGKVGSATIAWLIECRDRRRKAGPEWIQQLPTRRNDHGFDKVTAVCTAGFTDAAAECAQRHGIELRTVKDAPPPDITSWLRVPSVCYTTHTTCLQSVLVELTDPSPAQSAAASKILAGMKRDAVVFKTHSENMTADQLFLACVRQHGSLFDDMQPNGPDKLVRLVATFDPPGAVRLPTAAGEICVSKARFAGELRFTAGNTPPADTKVYLRENGEKISETAVFQLPTFGELNAAIEFHNLSETNTTSVVIRTDPKPRRNESV